MARLGRLGLSMESQVDTLDLNQEVADFEREIREKQAKEKQATSKEQRMDVAYPLSLKSTGQ